MRMGQDKSWEGGPKTILKGPEQLAKVVDFDRGSDLDNYPRTQVNLRYCMSWAPRRWTGDASNSKMGRFYRREWADQCPDLQVSLLFSCWVVSDFLVTPWTISPMDWLLCPWGSPGKNTGVGCHALLQGIFRTQGSNPGLFCPLHRQAGSLPLSHLGRPKLYLSCLII